jgi:hypothetical protein
MLSRFQSFRRLDFAQARTFLQAWGERSLQHSDRARSLKLKMAMAMAMAMAGRK